MKVVMLTHVPLSVFTVGYYFSIFLVAYVAALNFLCSSFVEAAIVWQSISVDDVIISLESGEKRKDANY